MTKTTERTPPPTVSEPAPAPRPLSFSGSCIEAAAAGPGTLRVAEPTIVVNTGLGDVRVLESPACTIRPLESAILIDTTIEHTGGLVLLTVKPGANADVTSITGEPGWERLGDVLGDGPSRTGGAPFDTTTPLWRSPQDVVGTVRFDPRALLRGRLEDSADVEPFEVRVNLWFAPAGTDCFIHNDHDFVEVHTQVHGIGRMQKFREQDHATIYQDLLMSPGYTTPDPFCAIADDGAFVYPWHQYYADTDCVWLAVEYHRIATEDEERTP